MDIFFQNIIAHKAVQNDNLLITCYKFENVIVMYLSLHEYIISVRRFILPKNENIFVNGELKDVYCKIFGNAKDYIIGTINGIKFTGMPVTIVIDYELIASTITQREWQILELDSIDIINPRISCKGNKWIEVKNNDGTIEMQPEDPISMIAIPENERYVSGPGCYFQENLKLNIEGGHYNDPLTRNPLSNQKIDEIIQGIKYPDLQVDPIAELIKERQIEQNRENRENKENREMEFQFLVKEEENVEPNQTSWMIIVENYIRYGDYNLNLSNSDIVNLNQLFEYEQLRNIKSLEISFMNLPNMNSIGYFINLKQLILIDTDLNENILEMIIDQLPNLEFLYLQKSNFCMDFSSIRMLRNLKYIEIDLCENINSLDFLSGCTSLEIVNCARTNINEIEFTSTLENLKYLNISNTSVTSLVSLTDNNSIEILLIDNCDIDDLEPLKNLRIKELSLINCNYIREISPLYSLQNLTKLKGIIGSNNIYFSQFDRSRIPSLITVE